MMMPHWSSYLWIGSICIVAAWCTYRYYLWARAMDKINADHFEFQKQRLWVEGVDYFVASDEPLSLDYSFPLWREDNDDHE
jgi:hypothetical protein